MRRSRPGPMALSLTPVILEKDGEAKEYFALQDGEGNIFSEKDFQELIKKVQPFYSIENIEEMIQEDKNRSYIEMKIRNYCQNYSIDIPAQKDGLFQIPEPRYNFKEFKTDKRHWSCKCEWCGNKISSKMDKGYYLISNGVFKVNERACSVDCVNLIWKDVFKKWIHENGYQKYFEQI